MDRRIGGFALAQSLAIYDRRIYGRVEMIWALIVVVGSEPSEVVGAFDSGAATIAEWQLIFRESIWELILIRLLVAWWQ
jgi:hypothetical protein